MDGIVVICALVLGVCVVSVAVPFAVRACMRRLCA